MKNFMGVAIIPLLLLAPTLAYATDESLWTDSNIKSYAQGYSHLPMSPGSSVERYKDGVADYAFTLKDKNWVFLGTWPTHSSDNYKDFYLGWKKGDDTYVAQQGNGNPSSNGTCPPGHSAEYCLGWKWGYFIPANGDAS